MKRVEVVWRDISFKNAGWLHKNDVDDFCDKIKEDMVKQLGYIYRENEESVFLVDSFFIEDNLFGSVHRIPRGCIISITEI